MLVRERARAAPWPPPMATRTVRRGPRLGEGWAVVLLFGGLFLWWFLGMSGFVQAIFAVPMFLALFMRYRGVAFPRRFWLWLLFLGFVVASGSQIHDVQNALSWGWRASVYIGSTIMFLYVYNTPRDKLPASRIINVLAAFWVLTVVGGLLGMALPNHSFHSLMQSLMPQSLQSNAFVKALIIPETTGGKTFPGLGFYRVKAPFIYTNQWGSAFALTLPFAFAVITQTRNSLHRLAFIGLLILAVVPLVFSLDRGSWLSAAVAATYGIFRLAKHGGGQQTRRMARAAKLLLFAGLVVAVLVMVSPLGGYILTRLNSGYGDQHRQILYSSSLTLVARQPILGYGAPVSLSVLNPAAPPGPSVGTHGTFWTILVSNGIPAMVFFGLWLGYAFVRTYRRIPATGGRDADAYFWCHVVVLAAISQLAYYELLPWGLPIVMIAIAAALRERRVPPPQPLPRPAHIPVAAAGPVGRP